ERRRRAALYRVLAVLRRQERRGAGGAAESHQRLSAERQGIRRLLQDGADVRIAEAAGQRAEGVRDGREELPELDGRDARDAGAGEVEASERVSGRRGPRLS